MGHVMNGRKYLAEGFVEGMSNEGSKGHGMGGHGMGGHGMGGHYGGTRGPPTFGRVSDWGYYPVYTQYEYPVYYTNPDYYHEVSDPNGMFYYLYNPGLFIRRIFGY